MALPRSVAPDQNLRRRGEDFRLGDMLYAPGRRLSAWDLALLATAGVAEVAVYARPRALVVATGDELVAPGAPLKPGQIYESNRLATLSLLAQLGADVSDGGTVRDDPAALARDCSRARATDLRLRFPSPAAAPRSATTTW